MIRNLKTKTTNKNNAEILNATKVMVWKEFYKLKVKAALSSFYRPLVIQVVTVKELKLSL